MTRERRRASRISGADYDRTADTPEPHFTGASADGERVVAFDDGDEEELTGLEFYAHERPPHHG